MISLGTIAGVVIEVPPTKTQTDLKPRSSPKMIPLLALPVQSSGFYLWKQLQREREREVEEWLQKEQENLQHQRMNQN
jgi:hypothetical protein